jgi:hypothetical protein
LIQNTIENDGIEPEKSHLHNTYNKMLTNIWIKDEGGVDERYHDMKQYIPTMMDIADHIIDRNTDINRCQ